MEIERKYLIKELPDLSKYEKEVIEQGYLNRNPAVRIRKSNDDYCRAGRCRSILRHRAGTGG